MSILVGQEKQEVGARSASTPTPDSESTATTATTTNDNESNNAPHSSPPTAQPCHTTATTDKMRDEKLAELGQKMDKLSETIAEVLKRIETMAEMCKRMKVEADFQKIVQKNEKMIRKPWQ